jgi:hypothetical protein
MIQRTKLIKFDKLHTVDFSIHLLIFQNVCDMFELNNCVLSFGTQLQKIVLLFYKALNLNNINSLSLSLSFELEVDELYLQ